MKIASIARVRSPGDSVFAGAPDVVRTESELREQRAQFGGRTGLAERPAERVEQRGSGREDATELVEFADDDARAETARASVTAPTRPSSASMSVVLPDPFGPADDDTVAVAQLEVDRAELETARGG